MLEEVRGKHIVLIVFIMCVAIIIYNYIDNNRVKVVKQDVIISNLPEEFENFTILQITDLHSKYFGNNQERLTKLINSQQYDFLVFTGDMGNIYDENNSAFIDLIEGINNKKYVFYIAGNSGPFVFENEGLRFFYNSSRNLKKNEMADILESYGIHLMDQVYGLKRGDNTLWISELITNREFNEKTNFQFNNGDIRIAITHYPMNESYYENQTAQWRMDDDIFSINNDNNIPIYDLVLAGHYHGGQWRVPILGALYIPDINGSNFLPSRERVSGLTKWGDYKQYVSRGLGASGDYKFTRFRFFNTPEINLIKLVRG